MEKNLKKEIVKIAKLLFEKNLACATGGNICVKSGDVFYITPHGMGNSRIYDINEEDILICDKDLTVIEGNGLPSIETKLHINVLLYLEDYTVSIHTHSPYGNVFAFAGMEIPVVSPVTEALVGRTPLVEEANPGSDKLGEGCLEKVMEMKNIRDGKAIGLVLKKHGVLSLAKSLSEAYTAIDAMEEAARSVLFSELLKFLTYKAK
jgi:L-fuculose-phosphate aldolase